MPTITDKQRKLSDQQLVEFVLSFVSESDKMRDEFTSIFNESVSNYLVNPFQQGTSEDKSNPLNMSTQPVADRPGDGYSTLKDSESHQMVETLLASTVLAVLGEPGFVQAKRVGFEDTFKAPTVTRLLEYYLTREGVFRTVYSWLKSGFIFGTGIIRSTWEYDERPATIREFSVIGGTEVAEESPGTEVVHDDPSIDNVNIMDFYPDPGQVRLHKMLGCAERFTIHGRAALGMAKSGQWRSAAVRRALRAGGSRRGQGADHESPSTASYEGVDRPFNSTSHEDFLPMTGYQYWGEVPWNPRDGIDWRKITVLEGELVQDVPWPLHNRRLPYYDFTVCPLDTRFYGVSPLETGRFGQDLADHLTRLIAEGAVLSTHPKPVIHRDAMIRLDQFSKFRPNQPILTDRMDGVDYLPYKSDLAGAQAILDRTKGSLRESSGATDVEQGLGFGTKRLSASEASIQATRSASRPEMTNAIVERDALPPLGKGLLRLSQQFLEDSDDLRRRVGESPEPFPIATIMADYDLSFVGSRTEHNKQSKLEALERIAPTIGALPVAPLFPWGEYMIRLLRSADLPELEAMVADPENTKLHVALGLVGQGGGAPAANGNGQAESQSPRGLLPAQVSGGPIGG